MNNVRNIPISEYTYNLPEDRIARYPVDGRDGSSLLVYKAGTIAAYTFSKIADHLESGRLLVYNNTKVIQARLIFYKDTGARIELFCLEPFKPSDFGLSFSQTGECTWKCIVGNLKKWKESYLSLPFYFDGGNYTLTAEKSGESQSAIIVKFSWDNQYLSFGELLDLLGQTPIPPYLERPSEDSDKENYQTVYSSVKGSVAAPTAGLHFTDHVFSELKNKDIRKAELSLHVGAGTFKPVQAETIGSHEMHIEHFSFTQLGLAQIIKHLGKIVAVGTTSVRTLESIYRIGLNIFRGKKEDVFHISQWEAYDDPVDIPVGRSMEALLDYMFINDIQILHASTAIMIVPGYKFKMVNGMITNFHQPNSTLLLLIASFIGKDWKKVYDYALDNNFRFLSYGDSSLLLP